MFVTKMGQGCSCRIERIQFEKAGLLKQERSKLVVELSWRDWLAKGVSVGAKKFIGDGLKHPVVVGLNNEGVRPPTAGLISGERVAMIGGVTCPCSSKVGTKAETKPRPAPTVAG